jgi:carotenoid cleavage dioxygenase
MGGRTYVIVEAGGLPVELTYTLESVARSNLGGTLDHGFVAHPKLDPGTGQLLAVSYDPRLEALTYMVVDPDGLAEAKASIPAPHRPMVHDMAFTPTWVIVLDLPVTFNPARMSTGLPFAWNPERTPRLGLLPRNGDVQQMRWVEAPSCYVFHVMNAFDDRSAVVMDVIRHPRTFDKEHHGPGEGISKLVRWRISLLTGKLTETVLEERGCEFPRFNDEFGGKEYHFGYTAATNEEFKFGPAFKHDVSTGRTEVHDYGSGFATLEPVFIARKGAVEEDDGWVMSYVYNAERNASDVVILDAKAFSEEPVASISLPVRVPFGFHGNWVPDHI